MYQKLLKWAHDSEIILFARLQYVGGVLLIVLEAVLPYLTDQTLSLYIPDPKLLGAIGIVNGIATELIRKYRATDLSPTEPTQ